MGLLSFLPLRFRWAALIFPPDIYDSSFFRQVDDGLPSARKRKKIKLDPFTPQNPKTRTLPHKN